MADDFEPKAVKSRRLKKIPDLNGKVRKPSYGDDKGCPLCYGTFKKGVECECSYYRSCREYTYDEKAMRSDDIHNEFYQEVPLNEATNADEEVRLERKEFHTSLETAKGLLNFDPGDVNIYLVVYVGFFVLENPKLGRAFLTSLLPGVRNLQDIADLLGVSRQAVQKSIANELGIGKRNYKVEDFAKLSKQEFQVYQLCMVDGCSNRSAAMQIGITEGSVRNILKRLKAKGFDAIKGEK